MEQPTVSDICKQYYNISLKEFHRMRHLEQYASQVYSYSSRYNNSNSTSYAPINVMSKYQKYPAYGDFPETYFLRTYGLWWKQSGSAKTEYRPEDFDLLSAQDFVIVGFNLAVIPKDICIYEVYNPGAVVRIWGANNKNKWILLWEGFPQKCGLQSRKFCPPLKKIDSPVDRIRLEFNQNHLSYYTSIDAILLGGYYTDIEIEKAPSDSFSNETKICKSFLTVNDMGRGSVTVETNNYFSLLPNEIILQIFKHLDLKSLSRCAQVNKRWNYLCQDQMLYQNISLKIYWNLVNESAIEYLAKKCINIKKLDLSWCDQSICSIHKINFKYHYALSRFLIDNKGTLTHLCFDDNCYVDNNLMSSVIANLEHLVELRLHNTAKWTSAPLYNLTRLVTLDMSNTHINSSDLIAILELNPNLEHLILDLCEQLNNLDQVVFKAAQCNKNLKTWSSWKTRSLTAEGIQIFKRFWHLEELDLGWCLITADPEDCLLEIANHCKKLRRLIISAWRCVSDELLMPIIDSCKELSQLDLLGIRNITSRVCEKALFSLPKLRLLDISFCDGVRQDEVEIWRQQYPHITIQRSCQFTPRQ